MTTTPPKFSIAICGGGIGGLCLAVALSRYPDIKIDVYESTQAFAEIGAGISVWKRTLELLKKLGCEEHFQKISTFPPSVSANLAFKFRRSDQAKGETFHVWELEGGMTTFHRAHFLDALVQSLPPNCSHFGKRCISYTQTSISEPVTLAFADGTTAVADAMVACDGINSTMRAQMYHDEAQKTGDATFEEYIDPAWSGRVVYRVLFPSERLKAINPDHRVLTTPHMYCGKNKHILVYPLIKGTTIGAAAYNSDFTREGTPVSKANLPDPSLENLRSQYVGWEPDVQEILECVQDEPPRWAVFALKPLPFYVRGKVALMGDAAHATTPHQGSGAGLGVEDAFLLSRLLGDPSTTKEDLPKVLLAYEYIRIPRTHEVILGSRENGLSFEFNGPFGEDLPSVGKRIGEITSWISEIDPEKDVLDAFNKLKELKEVNRVL